MKLDKLKIKVNEIYYICINKYTNEYFSYNLCDTADIAKVLLFYDETFAKHYLEHFNLEKIYKIKKIFK